MIIYLNIYGVAFTSFVLNRLNCRNFDMRAKFLGRFGVIQESWHDAKKIPHDSEAVEENPSFATDTDVWILPIVSRKERKPEIRFFCPVLNR